MINHPLHSHWTLQAVDDPSSAPEAAQDHVIPAVPGCVHTTLLAARPIGDPYLDCNELLVQRIGQTDWYHTSNFQIGAALLRHDVIELVYERLDKLAKLELDGRVISELANLHICYRFGVEPLLHEIQNRLRVTFTSALQFASIPSVIAHAGIGKAIVTVYINIGHARQTTSHIYGSTFKAAERT